MGSDELEAEILEVIGADQTVALANAFGGTRLYVPSKVTERQELSQAIGLDAAQAMSARFAPDTIRVPLMRERRAVHFLVAGLSVAKIAVRLGMTETGVEKLLKRLKNSGTLVEPPCSELRTVVGPAGADALISVFGGEWLRLPDRPGDDDLIVRWAGHAVTQALIARYGDSIVRIPPVEGVSR
jgi:biotin operon repressor